MQTTKSSQMKKKKSPPAKAAKSAAKTAIGKIVAGKIVKVRAVSVSESKTGFKFDYAPSIESRSVVQIKAQNELFIGGGFVQPAEGKYFVSENPATGEPLTQLAEAGSSDVDKAVRAARVAYEKTWSKMSGAERGRYLFRISRILQERAREFAVLETIDNGKSIKESRDVDVPLASAHFFYYAGWADKIADAFPGRESAPLGVVGAVIPWNFPLLMAAWKIAPALAAGNTVVLKPAEQTSLSALLLAEVCQEAGLPEGVVNIVTGAGATGAALVSHPDVNKVAFTGSTEIGKLIAKTIAGTGKKLTLELGGKSAQIVYEDAALDQAVEGVVNGIYFNQGHVCCAGSRLLLEESIHDLFLAKLKKRMRSIRLGDPLDKNTDIGAINSRDQLDKIKSLVKTAEDEGCEYYQPEGLRVPAKGYYHAPCFIAGTCSTSTVNRVEIFGPVLTVQSFRTPEEAIKKANDTPYGLAAGIWSEKASKIHRTAKALKAGVIWTNTYNKFDPASPFGGYKESGYGREGGLHGLLPFLKFGGVK